MSLDDIKLKILVFGPSPTTSTSDPFLNDLAKKRLEIKVALLADGHVAVFPEDLVTGSIDPAFMGNTYLWEQTLVREYDMVVNLVGSFGAVAELGLFNRDNLALKAVLLFNQDHTSGLAYQHARALSCGGAALETYAYPIDLTCCNLMKNVRNKVYAVRVGKFLSP